MGYTVTKWPEKPPAGSPSVIGQEEETGTAGQCRVAEADDHPRALIMNTGEIRRRFVDYYTGLGFHPLPRAPMLHPSIPMSFVMSARLVQIETSLAQVKDRPGDQFVLVQECFHHFNLDKVGTDDIHLSLFEIPATFTFNPNGRAGTVRQIWTLARQ